MVAMHSTLCTYEEKKNVYSIRIIRETYKELEVVMYMYIYNKFCLHLTAVNFGLFSVTYCMSCLFVYKPSTPCSSLTNVFLVPINQTLITSVWMKPGYSVVPGSVMLASVTVNMLLEFKRRKTCHGFLLRQNADIFSITLGLSVFPLAE